MSVRGFDTVTALDICPDDIIAIWRVAETLFACNPRLADGSGIVLSFANVKAMIYTCFEDNSFRKAIAELE